MNQASSGISLVSQQNPMNQPGVQRVKSLLQTSAKLPSRLPPGGHSGPLVPQRSVSHNETGMRNYYNGGGGSTGETPPGSMPGRAHQGVGPGSSSSSGSLFMGA